MRQVDADRAAIEGLECRRMLSAVPQRVADLAIDERLDFTVGGPTSTGAGGSVFFSVPSRFGDSAELWRADPDGRTTLLHSYLGYSNPTATLVANLSPGAGTSAYFTVSNSTSGISGNVEVWYTDGTAAGTQKILPFSGSVYIGSGNRAAFVRVGTNTFFTAGGLMRASDVAPTQPVGVTGASGASGLTVANGALYFLDSSSTQQGLYRVNDAGTSATRVAAVSSPQSLANVDGTLYFMGSDPASGAYKLFKSDGTAAGTQGVAPVSVSIGSPPQIVGAGGRAYFVAHRDDSGYELWTSDGTAAGTTQVIDLYPGTAWSDAQNLTAYNGQLYFTAQPGFPSGRYLYRTDGTAEGTQLVTALDGDPSSAVVELKVVGDSLYFTGRSVATGSELWRVDAAGDVRLVSDRYPGHGSSRPHELIDVGGTLYYQGIDPVLGYALFRTDGTAAGTSVVKDYLPGPSNPNFVNPYFANTGDGRVFYSDGDGTSTGRELYVTDGTAAGTRLVKDILPGVAGSSPAYLAAVGGTVFFAAQGSTAQGVELWKSDGTAAGTVLVKNIHSDDRSLYSNFSSNPANLTAVNGAVYFAANDGVNGTELWRTDGTAAGTVMYDLYAGSSSSNPQSLIAVGSTLFFVTQGGSAATLWRVAPGDAKPVAIGGFTVVASSGQRGVQNLASVNGTLYFAGDDGTHGMEVWKSDGTAAGTVMIKDIRTVPDQQNQRSSSPGSFMAAGNYVVFYADDGVAGRELWRTDGTAAGTTLLKDIYPNKFSDSVFNGSSPFPRVTYNGQAYFTATDDTHGTELWRTDGTPAGTVLVKDVWPGSKNSSLNSFGVAGGRLFFSADDGGGSGAELWTTDGTDAGTIRAADLSPGAGSSQPARFMDVNGAVVFFASDGVNGPSLFRFEPEDVKPTVVGTRFARVGGKAAVVVDFDEDVAGSLAGTDLVVTNLTTGQVLDPAAFTVAYDAANNRATFTLGSGLLADGNYRVTLAANGVRDTSDNPLAADGALDFFVLAGDVNGDRVVNFSDLLVLAKNYGRSGVGLAEGDFDGDGVVNFADLLMLAKNYNRTLDVPPPPPAPAPVMAVAAALPMATKRQASPAKPLFSTRPVVARPAPAKGKGVTAAKRGL